MLLELNSPQKTSPRCIGHFFVSNLDILPCLCKTVSSWPKPENGFEPVLLPGSGDMHPASQSLEPQHWMLGHLRSCLGLELSSRSRPGSALQFWLGHRRPKQWIEHAPLLPSTCWTPVVVRFAYCVFFLFDCREQQVPHQCEGCASFLPVCWSKQWHGPCQQQQTQLLVRFQCRPE